MLIADSREVFRYLGYRGGAVPDERIQERIRACSGELNKVIAPKYTERMYSLSFRKPGTVILSGLEISSRDLYRSLRGCSYASVFAATLGIGPDRLIARAQARRVSDAVILQAVSAAMIESWCDDICQKLRNQYAVQQLYLRPRFSPGYGDFVIEWQRPITDLLMTPKTIGLTLTEHLLMLPSKSVTAIAGLSSKPVPCSTGPAHSCDSCDLADCHYRRE